MKLIKIIVFTTFLFFNLQLLFSQNITVNDSYTAQQLVENVLVNSSCANVSNASTTGDTYTTGKNSFGYFNNAGSSFPFNEGVILSTWSSTNAIGPYIADNAGGGDPMWKGDPDLDQALGNTNSTLNLNATVLEFDFIPLTNFISFNYIFASNEYQSNYPCNYFDSFAFLIKENGSSSNFQNIALIPNTTTPVSSFNIHPKIGTTNTISGCPAINENYFNGFNTASNPINFAGQTIVMNAQTSVTINKSYHIKLVIEDDLSRYFDSAVFLQAGSFDPKINLGQDRLLATNNPICFGDRLLIETKLPTTYTYKWYKDGSTIPIPGETSPAYLVSDSGIYTVEVVLTPASCSATAKIKIEFTPEIVLANTSLTQCDINGNGISQFDLTKADPIIKNGNSALGTVLYYESLLDAKGNINPILNPETYINKPSIPILYARVTNTFNCVNYAQLDLYIANNTIGSQNPISICDEDIIQDGLYQFDLNTQVTPQVLTGLPSGMVVEYYLSSSDAKSQKNPQPTIFKNTIAKQQKIYARIVNGPDCFGIIPITLIVNTFDPPNFQDENVTICEGISASLSVDPGYFSYLWNNGATTNSISTSIPGHYTVKVTNAIGCEKLKKFTVTASGIATITEAIVYDFSGFNNSILLQFTGVGSYEFTLDGTFYQDNALFTGIAPGKYFAYARDKDGCGISAPYTIYILDYPRFFTPNGDGYNDSWNIKNLNIFPQANTIIYNRYGKIIKVLNPINQEWDGIYLNKELPSDDYWFLINFDADKIIKGHFSLKR